MKFNVIDHYNDTKIKNNFVLTIKHSYVGKIVNITIDGKTYIEYKKAYDGVKENKIAIDFGNNSFYSYGWTFYAKDEAVLKMAKEFEFIQLKHIEQYNSKILLLEDKIKELKLKILELEK